ncbi:hypothetical protein RchiOBHm_Chr3g0454841 [Rosa chinensis]|uniref:Uncharacterized protein n=1 Tax=Rosa chinensis TaxID=74649 RepID=A0A2P6R6X0_ROSCH|nr:hypothetical protein RchiOBHm_Chr3g0454841 [Rosa chinensis]
MRGFRSIHKAIHAVVLKNQGGDILPKKIIVFGEFERDEVSNMIGSNFWRKERRLGGGRRVSFGRINHDEDIRLLSLVL